MAYPSETELTTVDKVRTWLQTDDVSADTALAALIGAVSSLIVLELNMENVFTTTAVESYDGCVGSQLFLRHRPIISVSAVSVNYGRQSISPSSGGSYGYVFNENIVTIIGGRFGKGPGHVSVSYQYGWSKTGREQKILEQVCVEEVAYRWKQRDHVGMASVSSGGAMSTTYVQQPLQRFSVEVLKQLWDKVPVQ